MSFDARTLLIVGGFLCWILAAAIEFQAVRPSSGRVMPDSWTLGLLAKGMGLNLISQRGLIADVWTIALAHGLLLSSLLFFYVALQRIRGVPANRFLVAAMPLTLAIVLPVIGFSQEAFQARVFVIMCAWVFGFSLTCWAAYQIFRAGYVAGAAMILGSNAMIAAAALAFAAAVATREVAGVFGSGGAQIAFYGINIVCIAIGTFGYMDVARAAFRQAQRIDDPSQPDRVTGLFGSATFARLSAGELYRAGESGYPVCVMAVRFDGIDDIDDDTLRRTAAILLREIRMFDIAGRVSTDLFAVVLPEMPLDKGYETAARIVSKVADDPLNVAPRISISIGLAEAQGAQYDLDVLLALATVCLDRAQAEGGNRVVTPASPPGALAKDAA